MKIYFVAPMAPFRKNSQGNRKQGAIVVKKTAPLRHLYSTFYNFNTTPIRPWTVT